MTHAALAKAVLAALLAGSVALQVAPSAEELCGPHLSYEAFLPMVPKTCVVYCVPRGECSGRAQTGRFSYLGLSRPGNCLSKGFTAMPPLGNLTKKISERLGQLTGPCKGMKLWKFQKPSGEEEYPVRPLSVDFTRPRRPGRICELGQTAYEAPKFQQPGECSVYCIPEGDCLGLAQMGEFSYLGITDEGNCRGYTEVVNETMRMKRYDIRDSARVLHGACMEMTNHTFKKSALAAAR